MITEIGIVAGDVWNYLDNNNKNDYLDNIVKRIERPRDIVLMSIGWLAREGHVVLEGDMPNPKVALRN